MFKNDNENRPRQLNERRDNKDRRNGHKGHKWGKFRKHVARCTIVTGILMILFALLGFSAVKRRTSTCAKK